MTETRRPVRVPDGHYAVPDPDHPAVLTLWSVVDGVARDWPERERWRPWPPKFEGSSKEERQQLRSAWYEATYFPWRAAVAEAIERDPEAARAAFVAEAGQVPPPVKPCRKASPRVPASARANAKPTPTKAQRRRQEAALMALALRMVGQSVRETGDLLDLPRSTVHRLTVGGVATTVDTDAVTVAVTLLRTEQLRDSLLVQRVRASGEDAERLDRYLADVEAMRRSLRGLLDAARSRDRSVAS